jgi:hypothetical protein
VCCTDHVRCTRGWTLSSKRVTHLLMPEQGTPALSFTHTIKMSHRTPEIGEVRRPISDFMLIANLVASARYCKAFEEHRTLGFRLTYIRVGPIWGCLLVRLLLCKPLRSLSLHLPPNGRDSRQPFPNTSVAPTPCIHGLWLPSSVHSGSRDL